MTVPELRSLYRDGRLLPFVGAGVSASVKWRDGDQERRGPTWDELVRRAAYELGFEDVQLVRARGTDLQILEYFRLQFSGYARLTNWLVRQMVPPDDALRESAIHSELVKMEKCSVIYTTNFDDFIERSFKLNHRPHKAVAIEEQMRTDNGIAEVVKFHGDCGMCQ